MSEGPDVSLVRSTKRALSILACGGQLPLDLAQTLRAKGYDLNIITIAGIADADFDGFKTQSVALGRVGAMLRALRRGGSPDLVIVGHLHRPDLAGLRIDLGFVRHFASILELLRGGDDHILRRIARFFERNGFHVRGIADLAPELLAPAGVLAGDGDPRSLEYAARGVAVIHALAPFDIGQAVIVSGGAIVGIEGAEGTNGLIERFGGRGKNQGALHTVLVKGAKPGQDLRLDLPTIGPETVQRCAAAGIGTIALEARHSLIVSRAETITRARHAKIAVVGIEVGRAAAARGRSSNVAFAVHARRAPRQQDHANALKGAAVLRALSGYCQAQAVLVEREHVIAVNVGEAMHDFLFRVRTLVRWGRRRHNSALIVDRAEGLRRVPDELLSAAGIAGIVVGDGDSDADGGPLNAAVLDALIEVANRNRLFLMSAA